MYILDSIAREKAAREMNGQNIGSIECLIKESAARCIPGYECLEAFYREIHDLDYDHQGLTPAQYMEHPLRVSRLAASYVAEVNLNHIKLALCHNVLELVGSSSALLPRSLEPMMHQLQILQVDRTMQWDKRYKEQYYQSVKTDNVAACIKTLDKLDNLYVLHRNPDPDTKARYLEEIFEYVLPLTEQFVPAVADKAREVADYQQLRL